jgi:hypothetical protein
MSRRRFTLAKRDAAFDAILDALDDPTLHLSTYEQSELRGALTVLTNLTSRLS